MTKKQSDSEHTIDIADVWQLAHKLTEKECNEKGIVYTKTVDDEEDCTAEAAPIFDRNYALIIDTLGIQEKEDMPCMGVM
jgi:hypothetical protein